MVSLMMRRASTCARVRCWAATPLLPGRSMGHLSLSVATAAGKPGGPASDLSWVAAEHREDVARVLEVAERAGVQMPSCPPFADRILALYSFAVCSSSRRLSG